MKLSVAGVDFSYRSHAVLSNISFDVAAGEVLCILGVNGAGKSTLLKCINRILKPQRSTVLINGKSIYDMRRREIAQNLGYVPQKHPETQLTVYEAILMGRRPHIEWALQPRDYNLVERIIHLLGLEDLAMRQVTNLSGGQLQKVIIARALAQSPNVLLLDEPISNLDLKNQIEVMTLVRNITREQQLASVVTIHDLNMAMRFGDKFLFIKDQEVEAIAKRDEFDSDLIERVYGVPVSLHDMQGHRVVVPI